MALEGEPFVLRGCPSHSLQYSRVLQTVKRTAFQDKWFSFQSHNHFLEKQGFFGHPLVSNCIQSLVSNSAPIIHTRFKALIGDIMTHVCMSGVIDLQGRTIYYFICYNLLYAADTQYIVEHFRVLFSYLDGTRCSKTAYMLSPFSCSGQTYIPTVKDFDALNFKWR